MRPLRIGVLGCANIARSFVRHVRPSTWVRVDAVASRETQRAAAFAQELGIARHLGSYEALLADPDIDCIYNPLPNSLHAPWSTRALEAGKHVLCEKPLCLSRAQAQGLFTCARRNGVMLLEAYPYWFQPQTGRLVQLLAEGAIGRVVSMQAAFGFTLAQPQGNIRMNPDLGGGALLDAGSYPVSLVRLVMGQAPQRVLAHASWAATGVDLTLDATLFFADGCRAQVHCGMNQAPHRRAWILGERGVIETEYLNHTGTDPAGDALGALPSAMRMRRGLGHAQPFEAVDAPTGSGFRFAAEAFATVIARRDQAAMDRAASASVDIAATLEAMALSAKRGVAIAL